MVLFDAVGTAKLRYFGPFDLIPRKILYVLMLLAPLGFLPLIYWKYGIIAAPSMGVNLLANDARLFSSNHHYEDLVSVLLLISCLMIFVHEKPFQSACFKNLKPFWKKSLLLGYAAVILVMLAKVSSPFRELWKSFPTSHQIKIKGEIDEFSENHPKSSVLVQTGLEHTFIEPQSTIFSFLPIVPIPRLPMENPTSFCWREGSITILFPLRKWNNASA